MNEYKQLSNELNRYLELVFTMIEYNGNLVEKRELISTVNNVRFEINSNDHPPPHFHVIVENERGIRIRMKIEVLWMESSISID